METLIIDDIFYHLSKMSPEGTIGTGRLHSELWDWGVKLESFRLRIFEFKLSKMGHFGWIVALS